MLEEEEIANNISAKDRNIGSLANQIVQCIKDENHFVAFCGLFVLAENTLIVKYKERKTFQMLIQESFENKVIDEREKMILDHLRQLRKLTVHSDPQQTGYFLNGCMYVFNENSTYELFIRRFSIDVLSIVEKIV